MEAVWRFLSSEAYWNRWRTREIVAGQIRTAWRVVGAYADGSQVGFARAQSDGHALAYLGDVYVLREHRGRGLGLEILREMIENGPGRDFRWLLHTADAHTLYAQLGFRQPPATLMQRPGVHDMPTAGK